MPHRPPRLHAQLTAFAGSAGVRARVSRPVRACLVSQPRGRATCTQRRSQLSNLPSAFSPSCQAAAGARAVLSVAHALNRPSFQRARCCGYALTFQQLATWQRNSKRSSHRPTQQVRVTSCQHAFATLKYNANRYLQQAAALESAVQANRPLLLCCSLKRWLTPPPPLLLLRTRRVLMQLWYATGRRFAHR